MLDLEVSFKEITKIISVCQKIRQNVDEGANEIYYIKDLINIALWVKEAFGNLDSEYNEFFEAFYDLCNKCNDKHFFEKNKELFYSTLLVFEESLSEISSICQNSMSVCPSCGHQVIYAPLSPYYEEMKLKYHAVKTIPETLNKDFYSCPICGCCDRDRLMIHFLELIGLREAGKEISLLQIAPAGAISNWLHNNCPNLTYDTTDLFMQNVTFTSDVQDMYMVENETYDIIICSHVLEHVQDDVKALKECKRILKRNGLLVFLVPIDLSVDSIDEAWGLSAEENWRRFGQGDHCRRYSKKGLLKRIEESGLYVNDLNKKYFGEKIFAELKLMDTSTLYVLTKDASVPLDIRQNR